ADAVERSGTRVAQLVLHEREFSANASHQLKTPLAALRLRLEDMTMWPETDDALRKELEASVGEVDRLTGTVEDLLALAREGGIGSSAELDLHEATAGVASRWQDRFGASERT